ncbi:unnamed protein product [Arctogadus glacialis]
MGMVRRRGRRRARLRTLTTREVSVRPREVRMGPAAMTVLKATIETTDRETTTEHLSLSLSRRLTWCRPPSRSR